MCVTDIVGRTDRRLRKNRMTPKTSDSPFAAVEPPARLKLSDSIVSQIEQLILEGTLKPGDKLPAEREFAERLRVSRPSLREALLKLEARGLVSARRGGGYAVADVTATTLTDPLVHLLQQHAPAAYDILELRHGLEEMAAFLAATRANDADRKEITRRYTKLVSADKFKGDELKDGDADLEFHMAVGDASHNVALMHVMRGLVNLLRTSTLRFRARIFSLHDGSAKLLHDQHRAIYEAVIKGDAPAAREAAHLHLSFIEATLREADRDDDATPSSSRSPAASKARRTKAIRT
jgi:GntR family transcriptional repressor for pyruvate dehydrogenase complex